MNLDVQEIVFDNIEINENADQRIYSLKDNKKESDWDPNEGAVENTIRYIMKDDELLDKIKSLEKNNKKKKEIEDLLKNEDKLENSCLYKIEDGEVKMTDQSILISMNILNKRLINMLDIIKEQQNTIQYYIRKVRDLENNQILLEREKDFITSKENDKDKGFCDKDKGFCDKDKRFCDKDKGFCDKDKKRRSRRHSFHFKSK